MTTLYPLLLPATSSGQACGGGAQKNSDYNVGKDIDFAQYMVHRCNPPAGGLQDHFG